MSTAIQRLKAPYSESHVGLLVGDSVGLVVVVGEAVLIVGDLVG